MMLADIARGHFGLADWLFLIAAVVFALEAFVTYVVTAPIKVKLWAVGLALVAVAFLVT